MKRKLLFILFAIMALVLTGCDEHNSPEKNASEENQETASDEAKDPLQFDEDFQKTISVGYQEGIVEVNFVANALWIASVDESANEWLKVSPKSGKKGKQTLTILYEENDQEEAREGGITISCGDLEVSIKLWQAKKGEAEPEGPDFEFTSGETFERNVFSDAGSKTFYFNSKVNSWIATSSVDWLTVSPASGGKGGITLTINFSENTQEKVREGKIIVSSGDNAFNIIVKQAEYVSFDIFTVMDDGFKKYCKKFDKNNDGKLSLTEGENVIEINVYRGGLESLEGIEYFPNLTTLTCNDNALTWLDVSKNTALTKLNCNKNQLEWLNVSGCVALTELNCGHNKLTTLDVHENTMLQVFECDFNKLTSLDVSKNAALTDLICHCNNFTSLDVSKNTALKYLKCGGDRTETNFASLNISGCVALTHLMCNCGKLTSLDVSKNTMLTHLECYFNNLTSLDVSKNTALTHLNCYLNKLTKLDVSKNTALTELTCGYNELTALDVSKNTALTDLKCHKSRLTSLDVSNNTALATLWCYSNKLTSLDISKHTALTELKCGSNPLTELDLSKNTILTNTSVYDESQSSISIQTLWLKRGKEDYAKDGGDLTIGKIKLLEGSGIVKYK